MADHACAKIRLHGQALAAEIGDAFADTYFAAV